MNNDDLQGDGPLPSSLQPRLRKLSCEEPIVEPVIGTWKCRTMECVAKVGVTETAIEAMGIFNGLLRRRGEPPISPDRVMYCVACQAELDRAASVSYGERAKHQAELVRELKAETPPTEDREREVVQRLRAMSYEGIEELQAGVRKRRMGRDARKAARAERADR